MVVLGGGFGGLYAARTLARANVRVILVDRRNYHLFQPLLYQVATAALSPGDIAEPLRAILRKYPNVHVLLGEVTSIDVEQRRVDARRWGQLATTTSSWRLARGTRISVAPSGNRSRQG